MVKAGFLSVGTVEITRSTESAGGRRGRNTGESRRHELRNVGRDNASEQRTRQ